MTTKFLFKNEQKAIDNEQIRLKLYKHQYAIELNALHANRIITMHMNGHLKSVYC